LDIIFLDLDLKRFPAAGCPPRNKASHVEWSLRDCGKDRVIPVERFTVGSTFYTIFHKSIPRPKPI